MRRSLICWLALLLAGIIAISVIAVAEVATDTDMESTNDSGEASEELEEIDLEELGLYTVDEVEYLDEETTSVESAAVDAALAQAEPEVFIPKSLQLGIKEKYTLAVAQAATFKSSKAKVASVDKKGIITAKKKGSAIITVTSDGKTLGTCTVKVLAAPKSVSLSKSALTLGAGETASLSVKLPKNTASQIQWSSNKKNVATVDAEGNVTAVAKGTAKITAKTFNGKKATCTVTVLAGSSPTSISLDAESISIGVKESYTVVPVLNDGAEATFTYATKNKKIATVSKAGTITGKKAGSTKITVTTHNGLKATLTVKVLKAPSKVTLNKTKATLDIYETEQLKATLPSKTTSKITWTSSNKKVATVNSDGLVTGIAKGTAKITAKTYNGKKAVCTITVTGNAAPTPTPVPTATPEPTTTPEPAPTEAPTIEPTLEPTEAPTEGPSSMPTTEPTATPEPSETPTEGPTSEPTVSPEPSVTPEPSTEPTAEPTIEPQSEIAIDATNFPDANFRSWVSNNCDSDNSGTLSNAEIAAVDDIVLFTRGENEGLGIVSLEGIGYFTALTCLDCSYNELTTLNLSANVKLEKLLFDGAKLSTIDLSHNEELKEFSCHGCSFDSLDFSDNSKLETVYIGGGSVRGTVTLNAGLKELRCFREMFPIDITGCAKLERLNIDQHGGLTTINLSKNPKLVELNVFGTQVASIDLTQNPSIKTVTISCNRLESVKAEGCASLEYLNCSENVINSLDIEGCTALKELYCAYNGLTSLNIRTCTGLSNLSCYGNDITALNVSNCTLLADCITRGNKRTIDESEDSDAYVEFSYGNSSLCIDGATFITGAQQIASDFQISNGVIIGYTGSGGDIEIPGEDEAGTATRSIGKSAFAGRTDITSVTIPESITEIGESAFEGCTSLSSVTLSNRVTRICRASFKNCEKLKKMSTFG